MTKRQQLLDILKSKLQTIKTGEDSTYKTDFDKVTIHQDTPTQYEQNHLNITDSDEKYEWKNREYEAKVDIYLNAMVVETQTPASELGNLALSDMIRAVLELANSPDKKCFVIRLDESAKWIETKGKTACRVELKILATYRFGN